MTGMQAMMSERGRQVRASLGSLRSVGYFSCLFFVLAASLEGVATAGPQESPAGRPRARALGIKIGVLETGPLNAITDVKGVRVGHKTLIEGDRIRTGVTAIVPHEGNIFQEKLPVAIHVANGFGKLVGISQVAELGTLETPIVLTNTLSTFAAADALIAWTLRQPGNETVRSVNPVAGECNDGHLNDIRAQRVTRADVFEAIRKARGGVVEEGSVGAGTGTRCLGWKGGIGTSSRRLPERFGQYTVGVLVQSNFSGNLTIGGAPVGRELGRSIFKAVGKDSPGESRGSCVMVVATDAPLDARQLGRLARRSVLGLAATGTPITHGSGDYVIAFSTHPDVRTIHRGDSRIQRSSRLRDEALSPLFQATREATEEAIINSVLRATTVKGYMGHRSDAIDIEAVTRVGRKFGVIER